MCDCGAGERCDDACSGALRLIAVDSMLHTVENTASWSTFFPRILSLTNLLLSHSLTHSYSTSPPFQTMVLLYCNLFLPSYLPFPIPIPPLPAIAGPLPASPYPITHRHRLVLYVQRRSQSDDHRELWVMGCSGGCSSPRLSRPPLTSVCVRGCVSVVVCVDSISVVSVSELHYYLTFFTYFL